MSIQIQQPELEALIRQRMQLGAYSSVEEALLQVLKSSLLPSMAGSSETAVSDEPNQAPGLTGADLVQAMAASPYKELNLEPTRERFPVREVAF